MGGSRAAVSGGDLGRSVAAVTHMAPSSDMIAHWLEQAGRQPLLTAAETVHLGRLVRRWQDWEPSPTDAPPAVQRRGRRARDRMVSANLRLVAHIARRARHGLGILVPDSELPDLLQAGAIGLMRGAERFDPARGYKASTYLYWWIRQGISRWADTSTRTIRLPSTHAPTMNRLGRLTLAMADQLGRQPTRAELAVELEMTVADLDHLLLIGAGCQSLDASLPGRCSDEPSTLGDLQAAPSEPDDPLRDQLLAAIAALDDRSRRLICGRYGIGEPQTAPMVLAVREGISVHRLRNLLRIAESRLRRLGAEPELLEHHEISAGEQLNLWAQIAAARAAGSPCSDDGLADD